MKTIRHKFTTLIVALFALPALQLAPIVGTGCLLLSGCETLEEYSTPAYVRAATALVCSNVISFAVDEADRIEAANYVYAVAHAIRSLSGGRVPTPAELRAAIALFTPNAGKWVTLATNISTIYSAIYPRIQGDTRKALEYLESIAAGCEDAALNWIVPTPAPVRR